MRASETPARPSRWRRWRQLLPNHWQILGLVCLIAAYEAFAWWVLSNNPRRADRMFPRIEYVATVSFPEFATYYGFDEGLLGYRQNVGQALMVLFENALVTIRRLVIGLVAGIGLGIGVGLLVGMSRWARDVVLPPVLLLRTIPILALIPLFMFWFGAREVGILIFVSFAVFSMMIVNTLEAIRNVPPIYQDYARCMGATRRQIYRTVIVARDSAVVERRNPGDPGAFLRYRPRRRIAGDGLRARLADDPVRALLHDRPHRRDRRHLRYLVADPERSLFGGIAIRQPLGAVAAPGLCQGRQCHD